MHFKNKHVLFAAIGILVFSSLSILTPLYFAADTSSDQEILLTQSQKGNSTKSSNSKASQNKASSNSDTSSQSYSTSDKDSTPEPSSSPSETNSQGKPKDETYIPSTTINSSKKIGKHLTDKMSESPGSELNVLVEFNLLPNQVQIDAVEKGLKGKIKQRYKNVPAMALTLSAQAIAALADRPDVKRVDLDFQVETVLSTSREAIQVDSSREQYGYSGKGVKVAVIDTGVDKTHPALFHAIAEAVDFTGEGPQDLNGHGTHVACIIACDDPSYSGVAPGVQIYSAKAINQYGLGMASDVLAALDWAMSKEVDLINLSLGGSIEECGLDVFSQIINQVSQDGFLPVVAAGNAGPNSNSISSPGCAEKALTVGASVEDQSVASFSSRGPTAERVIKPDLVAPGVNIIAAFPGGRFASLSGTSMATPHLTGVAALLLEINPNLTPQEIKELVKTHAKDLLLDPNVQGEGLVQSLSVLDALLASQGDSTDVEEQETDSTDVEEETDSTVVEEEEDEGGDKNEEVEKGVDDSSVNAFGQCVSRVVREKLFDSDQKQLELNNCREQFHRHQKEERKGPEKETGLKKEGSNELETSPVQNSSSEVLSSTRRLDFEDTSETEWFYPYLYSLKNQSCIQGYADGEFKPDRDVSLGEGLKLVTKCLLEEKLSEEGLGHWAEEDLTYLRKNYTNQLGESIAENLRLASFNPSVQLNVSMNRGSAVELLVSFLKADVPSATETPFADVPLSHPNVDAIAYAKDLGLVGGDEGKDQFRPEDFLKRSEMSKLVFVAKQLR